MGRRRTSAKETPLQLEMRKTSVKEMIKPPQRRSPQLEMEKNCAKETSTIGVKISAKEIPSELKKMQKSPPIVSRYCFTKHGLN